MKFTVALVLAWWMSSGLTPSAQSSFPRLPAPPPEGLPGHVLPEVAAVYNDVTKKGRTLTEDIGAHSQKCDRFLDTNLPLLKACQVSAADIELRWARYDYEAGEYSKALAALRAKFPLPRYVPAGRGLVLGLTAIGGFNVPPSLDPPTAARVRAQGVRQLSDMQSKAGVRLAQQLHTDGYNLILGLASSPVLTPTDVRELVRAVTDSVSNGQVSRLTREVYPSLTGRYFETLECHSNGAMVCLAALAKGDVAARSVRLLGPQITPQSVAEWETLLERGYTNRVDLYWMGGDPIPFAAMGLGIATQGVAPLVLADLRDRLVDPAPALGLHYFRCPLNSQNLPMVECHSVRLYQEALTSR